MCVVVCVRTSVCLCLSVFPSLSLWPEKNKRTNGRDDDYDYDAGGVGRTVRCGTAAASGNSEQQTERVTTCQASFRLLVHDIMVVCDGVLPVWYGIMAYRTE